MPAMAPPRVTFQKRVALTLMPMVSAACGMFANGADPEAPLGLEKPDPHHNDGDVHEVAHHGLLEQDGPDDGDAGEDGDVDDVQAGRVN